MVHERSSYDEADINAKRISAIRILRHLNEDVVFDPECPKMNEDSDEEEITDESLLQEKSDGSNKNTQSHHVSKRFTNMCQADS